MPQGFKALFQGWFERGDATSTIKTAENKLFWLVFGCFLYIFNKFGFFSLPQTCLVFLFLRVFYCFFSIILKIPFLWLQRCNNCISIEKAVSVSPPPFFVVQRVCAKSQTLYCALSSFLSDNEPEDCKSTAAYDCNCRYYNADNCTCAESTFIIGRRIICRRRCSGIVGIVCRHCVVTSVALVVAVIVDVSCILTLFSTFTLFPMVIRIGFPFGAVVVSYGVAVCGVTDCAYCLCSTSGSSSCMFRVDCSRCTRNRSFLVLIWLFIICFHRTHLLMQRSVKEYSPW